MRDPEWTVAHDTGTRYLNRSENWIYHQVRHLRGVRSIFLAKRLANLQQFPWEPVYTVERLSPGVRAWNRLARNVLGYYPVFARVCRDEGVDLLHAHGGLTGLRAVPLSRTLKVPLVTSFYGRDMFLHPGGNEGLRRLYRSLFARGEAFVAEGPAAREQLIDIGCPPAKIRVHRIGVDLHDIPYHPRAAPPGAPLRVLIAARFVEKKGLPYAVEAFCRAARDEPRLRLSVVGDSADSPEEREIRDTLRGLISGHGVADRVRFHGFVTNERLHELAREHQLFLHPSVHAANGDAEGGHPVVLTEMAASGMPIVATRHCDIPQVVVDGETGWLCPERDVSSLVAALRDAAARPEAITEYGRNGRRLVEARYDVRERSLDDLYAELLADGRASRRG